MARSPSPKDAVDQIHRMQEQIRQLRLRGDLLAPVTDGSGGLCAGWYPSFISEPPENTGTHFGFYRDTHRVYWRGSLEWSPDSSVLLNPGDQHDPDNDAINLFRSLRDGVNTVAAGGQVLPQAFWPDSTIVVSVPVDNQNTIGYTVGRWAQMLITWDGIVTFHASSPSVIAAAMASGADASGDYNLPRDASDRIHCGVPYGSILWFDSVNYRPRF